jgi:hypothetical protein
MSQCTPSTTIKKQILAKRQAWWYMYIIPIIRTQRQEDHRFEDSLYMGYIVRSCFKKMAIGRSRKEKRKERIVKHQETRTNYQKKNQ